ncbi:hypothetical protein [Microcoleus sp. B3-D3]|uniref:hypothetical protein n=1 Tax=Microcoleus sp. B3-D3 TaxID=2818656 RepID=UPI002FD51984
MPINLKRSIEHRHRRGSIALPNHPLPECRKIKANFVFICRQCIDKIPPESYDWSTDLVGQQKPTP